MIARHPRVLILIALCLTCPFARAAGTSAAKYLDKPDEWFGTPEAAEIAADILSYQTDEGGWPKNIDTATTRTTAPAATNPADLRATFDNNATVNEVRFLARIFTVTHEPKYQQAFARGLDYVLGARYPNGGWPQRTTQGPDPGDYHRHITFNDGAMARVMFFVKEVWKNDSGHYAFVDDARRAACKDAFDRGVQCILKCQVRVNDKLTVWCAQHDEHDFSPAAARTFELVSLSGSESVGVVHVLMSIEDPSPEVVAAVDAAVAWFDSVKIPGIRVEDRKQPGTPKGFERYVVEDSSAPPMWARFYEIGTNRPIFADRDSVKKYSLAEIGIERRTGYKWLGYWPQNLIAKEYPEWKAKLNRVSKTPP